MRSARQSSTRTSGASALAAAATIASLLAAAPAPATATVELTPATFDSTINSGRSGMIKFYQSWCGHSIRMKPDWDKLASEVDSSSVFIADVNCGNHKQLCDRSGVTGYPTVRYYLDGREHPYEGGRSFEALMEFVEEELSVRCDVGDVGGTCSERAGRYVDKWRGREAEEVRREMGRLEGMSEMDMTADLRGWLRERVHILGQLIELVEEDERRGDREEDDVEEGQGREEL